MEKRLEPAAPARQKASPAPAVGRALDILEHLSSHAEGRTLTEISQVLQMPANGVFRIAQVLVARGYLAREEATKRFQLTTRLLTIGQPRCGEISLVESALGPMRELREQTRETVQLGLRAGAGGVIIEKVEGLHALRIAVDVGLRFPLHNNAPGKLLLAFQPSHDRARDVATIDLPQSSARTITDRTALLRECERIVEKGYSTDHGEADEGIHCVAAPVFGPRDTLLATIWVSAPARRMPKESFPDTGRLTILAAAKITAKLRN